MMYPILYCLLGLTTLSSFAVSIPANRASGGTNGPSLVTPGDNPLPPRPPQQWHPIPGTSLTIHLTGPLGAPIPSLNIVRCVNTAEAAIESSIRRQGDALLPSPDWQFTDSNVHLTAFRPYPNLGTYTQLYAAIGALQRVMRLPGEPGERSLIWVLYDERAGIVMKGTIGLSEQVGTGAVGGAGNGATS